MFSEKKKKNKHIFCLCIGFSSKMKTQWFLVLENNFVNYIPCLSWNFPKSYTLVPNINIFICISYAAALYSLPIQAFVCALAFL